jgi:excisionase family DNA binding protein
MTVNETARMLGVSRDFVYRLVTRAELPAHRVGERLRFRSEDVDAYLERHREPAP